VLVVHGRFDPLLPFRGGERIAEVLAAHGFPVVFQGFDGGHEIPRSVLTAVQKFLVAPGTRASA
jgi:predicted esterase